MEKKILNSTLSVYCRVNYFTWETYNESLMWADSLAAPTNSRPNVPLGILGESRALIRFFYEFGWLKLTQNGVLNLAQIIITTVFTLTKLSTFTKRWYFKTQNQLSLKNGCFQLSFEKSYQLLIQVIRPVII